MFFIIIVFVCRPTKGAWKARDHRLRQHIRDLAMGATIRQRWKTNPWLRRGDEGQILSRLD